jgi:hypothetical protein
MQGRIDDLKFEQDRKGNAYAVAKVAGEDIYTWDKSLIELLQGIGEGAGISYELADKGDFKFEKFKSLEAAEYEPAEAPPDMSILFDDRKRIAAFGEMKYRDKSLMLAGMQVQDAGLSLEEKYDKTVELANKYMDYITKGYKYLFDGIKTQEDED